MDLMDLVEGITTSLDNKKTTICIFIDLKNSFDTIKDEILLRKLIHYGVHGIVYQWMSSYLDDRQQYGEMNYASSSTCKVKYDVLQGSILGPKLFSIYINDIF